MTKTVLPAEPGHRLVTYYPQQYPDRTADSIEPILAWVIDHEWLDDENPHRAVVTLADSGLPTTRIIQQDHVTGYEILKPGTPDPTSECIVATNARIWGWSHRHDLRRLQAKTTPTPEELEEIEQLKQWIAEIDATLKNPDQLAALVLKATR